ncbi:hypothetical protein IQ264_08105 [Phormidium sp. LEGE 05292]|uniref:hypothetical protein n=1 Tax=[Phormidium] sp. LEGE 05292 TaxID=767427 RepID=UPI0018827EFA|nr:hypothetical protein [Phormidium sp. LEGE 05292]MBE9225393.1 hypothetical protein [Phormidium sp. LEGE 05292]
MKKKYLITTTIAFLTFYLLPSTTTLGGTCAGASCPPPPIGFTPGQWINYEVVNRTGFIVELQNVPRTPVLFLRPGEQVRFPRQAATEPNLSSLSWDATPYLLRARLSKPSANTLRVEITPGGLPGDRALYIRDDGRVIIF